VIVEIKDLSYSYDRKSEVLRDVCFVARSGQVTTIIGANGAGKTTTLKCIAGLHKHDGSILFDGKPIEYDELTEHLSYMEQNTDCSVNLDVFSIVMLGMVQNIGFRVTKEDIGIVNEVLELVGISDLAGRKIGEISGGQRQLVFLAQALVKQPDVLLLDEPTGALDLYHQIKLMKLVKWITAKRNCVTIMTLHHLDMAMKYADNVVAIHDGTVYSSGSSEHVFTEKMLRDVYHVDCEILIDSRGERYMHILDFDDSADQDLVVSNNLDFVRGGNRCIE